MSRDNRFNRNGLPTTRNLARDGVSRRSFVLTGTAAAATAALAPAMIQTAFAEGAQKTRFRRVPTQYIAALGARDATSGDNAEQWGLWRQDPGPRGVMLDHYERLKAADGVAPAQWKFDPRDWWLEEHGLIMEQPDFPLPANTYLVTGGREVITALRVHPAAADGTQRWELDDGATLYDVTHLRCRSARYTSAAAGACTPAQAKQSQFPVRPGASMPPVEGCHKQDYAVLIVIGEALDSPQDS